MSAQTVRTIQKLAVIGAGNMGSGIAQKMATEGFDVVLVDLDDAKVARGLEIIKTMLAEGVERKVFRAEQAEKILGRVSGTSDWSTLGDVDLAVEAVFEDLEVKRDVFRRLEKVCRDDTILATNTSSFAVSDIASAVAKPDRVVGLHYFYHPAKNRLVEVIPGKQTSEDAWRGSWALQEQIGKTPIFSADASGFVVNRYFVVWLNEATRLLEEGVADLPTIEAACKQAFRVGMGPFELMNVTGVPIALHAATTLGQQFGPFYAPTQRLADQVASGDPWPLDGDPDESRFETVANHMLGATFFVAASLVDEGVGTVEDTDIGARVGLRWPKGPFELMNRCGIAATLELVQPIAKRWEMQLPALLTQQAATGAPFQFQLVKSEIDDGIATLTVNRPDAMNALNEGVTTQLHDAFRKVAADDAVRGIVIAGAGKAFIAGADIRFFVRNIEKKALDRTIAFTKAGQALLLDIDHCKKPVIARLHGLALGGGLELALACDKIFATPKAAVAFPETGIGIYPGLGGTQRTPRKIGTGLAKWLIYTGEMLDARRALDIALVDAVVGHDRLDAAIRSEILSPGPPESPTRDQSYNAIEEFFLTHDIAALTAGPVVAEGSPIARALKQIGRKAPIALRIAEKLIDDGEKCELDEGLQLELDHLPEIFGTEDAYEGLSSLGRRRPEFKNR